MFLKPEKLQNHSNEGKRKEKQKKKAMVALLVFIAELHARATRAPGRSPIAKEMW